MFKQATSLQEVNALPVTHAENFPVASWLCPPHLRPAIAAIYAFARAADDMADEGEQGPAQRLEALKMYNITQIAMTLSPSKKNVQAGKKLSTHFKKLMKGFFSRQYGPDKVFLQIEK